MRVASALPDGRIASAECRVAFRAATFATWGYDAEYARRASDPRRAFAGCAQRRLRRATVRDRGIEARRLRCAGASQTTRGRRTIIAGCGRCCARSPRNRRSRRRAGHGDRVRHAAAGGTRLRGARRSRVDRQTHEPDRAALGSFVFLGEIVTTLELPPDAPLRKTCGACARCVEACPTQALRGDYTIDANRCISDLTQRTDAIPAAMRPLVGRLGVGLRYLPTRLSADAPRAGGASSHWAPRDAVRRRPALVELLRCAAAASSGVTATTAMGWRGAAVLRRNAAVALGNALDRSAVGALIESLKTRSASDGARSRRLGSWENRLASRDRGAARHHVRRRRRSSACAPRSAPRWRRFA